VYDLVPIWGWLAGVGAFGGVLRLCRIDVVGRLFACRSTADATNFALTVLPVGTILSLGDSGPQSASWGKRRTGLAVRTVAGGTPTFGQAARRNAVKLAGWQTAHLGLLRVTGGVSHRNAHAIGSALLWGAYLVCAVDAAPAVARRDGRALHDLAAGTQVVATTPPSRQ
jgi:uncharacterized RDD family membrane protein YckC